jgi:hypothetical protein
MYPFVYSSKSILLDVVQINEALDQPVFVLVYVCQPFRNHAQDIDVRQILVIESRGVDDDDLPFINMSFIPL